MEHLRVTDPGQIRVLLGARGAHVMSGYGVARTETEAAEALREPLQRVHYWTGRLLRAGLIEIVDEIPRTGRAMKRYRAVALRLTVPRDLVPVELREQFADGDKQRLLAAQARQRATDLEVVLCRDHGAELPSFSISFDRPAPGEGYDVRAYFHATPEQSRQIEAILRGAVHEIRELLGRNEDGPRWLLHVDLLQRGDDG